jgi:hypothetical protein
MGKDAQVQVGFVHQTQRDLDGLGILGRQVFHHLREHALAQTGVHHLLAMLRQIAGRAADHDCLDLLGVSHGGPLLSGTAMVVAPDVIVSSQLSASRPGLTAVG